ncbi:threonine-phosphate decarboxylase [Litorivivens sp.]|uniref:threonine-phosphate decarboxylase n=1 Tax=Litorivivens sp. TaxID=2020868 RepID=UPI0035642D5C
MNFGSPDKSSQALRVSADSPTWELLCEHGGNPEALSEALGISPESLLDLSSAVSPEPYPLPAMPPEVLTGLPYHTEPLLQAAAGYFGMQLENILACSGSQAIIQVLPRCRQSSRVLLPEVGYAEHRQWWVREGHHCSSYAYPERESLARRIVDTHADVLVLIHPNNPTGHYINTDDLQYWRATLKADAWIVVDEAFIDPTPDASLISLLDMPGLIILRSAGKFFGLPGLRLGFALAAPELLRQLDDQLGPWPVSAAALWAGPQLLTDIAWQNDRRTKLRQLSDAQYACLRQAFPETTLVQTPLFTSMRLSHHRAERLVSALLSERVALRYYRQHPEHAWLRVGLAKADQLERLQGALASIQGGLSSGSN